MPLRQQKYKKHIPGFSQKRVRFTVWLELRSPLLLPFESKSQLLSPYKKALRFKNGNAITGDRFLEF